MTRKLSIILATLGVALFSNFAVADQIDVSYEIGQSPAGLGGFSGSWVHSADGCVGEGPDSGGPLYMCPDSEGGLLFAVEGQLTGVFDTDTGILSNIGGFLNVFVGTEIIPLEIFGGNLGGDFWVNGWFNWFLDVEGQILYFEDIGMIGPNQISEDVVILWGQTLEAYCFGGAEFEQCYGVQTLSDAENGLGIDLYGTQTASVPEPGSLALLGIGLLGMGAARRAKGKRAS